MFNGDRCIINFIGTKKSAHLRTATRAEISRAAFDMLEPETESSVGPVFYLGAKLPEPVSKNVQTVMKMTIRSRAEGRALMRQSVMTLRNTSKMGSALV